ncbi:gamma-sarcoglycan-like [Oncorhynchus clarkii lewisi]|uniref:gamma-sarcoglycan-like n=1 Tax=Oncorhynchus clarkii lewisi TaxID=490388 RepID=UPI0039B9842A
MIKLVSKHRAQVIYTRGTEEGEGAEKEEKEGEDTVYQYPPPAEGAEGPDTEEQNDDHRLGVYGWRKRCLYLLVLLLLSTLLVNIALTIWILRVTCLNTEGMGQLRITSDRVRLDGVSEFLFSLYAQEIHSKQDTSLLIHSESQNVTLQACNGKGGVLGSLNLGPQSMESVGQHFEVMTSTGKLLFSAGTEQVVVGADKLTITGSGGAQCEHSIETSLVRAEHSMDLRLEAPTRSLHLDAPKGVHIKAVSGSGQAVSSMDISLLSMDGVLILDAERVQLPRLPLSGEGEKGSPGEQLYEVCVCPDGRLYLSKAGHTSTCHDNSHNC